MRCSYLGGFLSWHISRVLDFTFVAVHGREGTSNFQTFTPFLLGKVFAA